MATWREKNCSLSSERYLTSKCSEQVKCVLTQKENFLYFKCTIYDVTIAWVIFSVCG